MKKLFLLLALACCISHISYAQSKFGYINSGELLHDMPEVTKADTEIAQYTRTYQEQLEAMNKEYQMMGQRFTADEKTMSDPVKEVKVKELQDLQNRIESTQQTAQDKVAQRKQDLLSPIIDKANIAIKQVAKENNYDYILDVSAGGLLYYREADNILPLVKAKLGLK